MITHKNAMTPRAKRLKAVTEAVRQASLVSCNAEMWHEQFEKTLGKAGYKIAKMTALEMQAFQQEQFQIGSGGADVVRSVAGPNAGAALR